MRPAFLIAAIIGIEILTSAVARAEISEEDVIEADRLFEEGRALVDAGKIAEGCAALARSQELDPSAGTLLNLALCHESEGRIAEARAELRESLVLATNDSREDRAAIARAHLEELERPERPAPVGLDLVVTAAVFFASGATRLSRVRTRARDRAPRDNASRAP